MIPMHTNFYGLGFKSINVGKTQISGIELSIAGQGKISPNNFNKPISRIYLYKPYSTKPRNRICGIRRSNVIFWRRIY